jgi:starch synthase
VVHLTAECFPFARTGGLAEAVGGLARHQALVGIPTAVVMPLFPSVRDRAGPLEEVGEAYQVSLGPRREVARLYRQVQPGDRTRTYFVRHDGFFERAGIYGEKGADYPDNAERFAFFGLAALAALPRIASPPILLHAHDWHTALALVHLRVHHGHDPWYAAIRTVLSVHNAGYQGHYRVEVLDRVGLPRSLYHWQRLEWYDQVNVLKGGLVFADAAVTVSPNHAAELRTPEGGFGLHHVFRWMGNRFLGILNGIDQRVWDPARDPHVIAPFDRHDPTPKHLSKGAVQQRFRLEQAPGIPLFVMTARLVTQKGLDLVLERPDLLTLPAQFAFLGAGEPRFERALAELARVFAGRIALDTNFRDELEHLLMAGGDFLLMPCQYEPCGLTQMRAQRYGALPVVRRVGGLADTVRDGETGFVFTPYLAEALVGAVLRALDVWAEPEEHRALMRAAMARDFSWERSVERYIALYREVLAGRFLAPAV